MFVLEISAALMLVDNGIPISVWIFERNMHMDVNLWYALKLPVQIFNLADFWRPGNLILRKQSKCGLICFTGGKNLVLILSWR